MPSSPPSSQRVICIAAFGTFEQNPHSLMIWSFRPPIVGNCGHSASPAAIGTKIFTSEFHSELYSVTPILGKFFLPSTFTTYSRARAAMASGRALRRVG